MKTKNLLTIVLLATASIIYAQETTKKVQTGAYDRIAVSGPFTINLVSGPEGNITVTGNGEAIEAVNISAADNTLSIKTKALSGKRFRDKAVVINIPFETLSEITVSGSVTLISRELISADEFRLIASGSGEISLNIEATKLEATMSGSGNIKLNGKASEFKSRISGSGNLEAFELKSAVTEVNVSGSGNSKVYSSESITARVSGSGAIDYKGNPKTEDTKVSGSGTVTKS